MDVVIKLFSVTLPVNAAEAPLVIVKLLMATDVPVIAPVVPAFRPKSINAPLMPAPKVIAAPAAEPPELVVSITTGAVVKATVLLKITLSPVVFKFTPAIIAALATVNALLNVEAVVANVTPVPPAVRVVMPVMLPAPVIPMTVMVPKPLAVMFRDPAVMALTSPASKKNPRAGAPPNVIAVFVSLVMLINPVAVKALLMFTSPALAIVRERRATPTPTLVKAMSPAPAVKVKATEPFMLPLKVRSPPAVSIPRVAPFNPTGPLKITLSPEVVKFTPEIVATLATVNALSNVELAPVKDTPPTLAVRVVMPVITPPPVTPFTVIVPAPAAVMFNAAPLVIRASSALSRLKPAPAVPKFTFTAVLLVMLTFPTTFMAAAITTSPALAMVSDESCVAFPTVELKVTVPAPAVSVRACAPFSVPVKVSPPPAVVIPTAPVSNKTVLLKITLSPEVVKSTPAIVAALATVNALSKVEPTVANVTPDPPAVSVVMPVIVPPPITPFTVMVPDAVMFNAPVLVTKSSSASVRFKPAPAVPKNTSTPVLLVMLTGPATFMAAPITTSPALAMVSDESCAEFPTVEPKVTVPAPAVSVRACAPFSVPVKVSPPPAVVIPTAPVSNKTVLLKITLSPEVVKSTPAIVAALATVNALSKVEPTVANVTPDPPAVSVVMPVIVPPPITPFTVMVPDAVMFNAPVLVTKSSSASVRFKPAPAVPKNTSTPVLLVMLTGPATFMAAPITTSPALAMVSDESCAEFPTVELNVTVPAPAVRVRACAPFSVLLKVRPPPLVLKFTGPPESVVVPVTVRPSKPLHVMPSKVTPPANELAVSPLVRVTSP